MVVSGYSMDLYCDCIDCEEKRVLYTGDGGPFRTLIGETQIGGETFKECLAEAKRMGWRSKENNTVCYAPGHKTLRNKP